MSSSHYRIVLPAGWSMIPVREGTDEAIGATIDTLLTGVPRDSRPAREHILRESLTSLADEARRAGGLDLIIPLVQPWVVPASVSILMSATGVGPDTRDVAEFASLSSANTAHDVVDTFGGKSLREQRDEQAPTADAASCARTITYTWLPERGIAIMATASITATWFEGYEQIVDALTELTDSILTTVKWEGEAAQEVEAGHDTPSTEGGAA